MLGYFTVGLRKYFNLIQMKLTLEQREILSRFHGPDEKLYKHFNARLDEMIIRFGISRMRRALDELKTMNDHVRKRYCVHYNFLYNFNSRLR